MYINGRWLIEPEIRDYIHKLEEERDELKQENSVILHETDRLIKEKGKLIEENEKMKTLLKAAMCAIKGIADREREIHVDELCCGYCEYDSPLTESGEMLYECPGCECNDCFKWKHQDEAMELIGEDGEQND